MQFQAQWTTPEVVEIGMNAEIGGYQADFTDSEPVGPRGPVAQAASDSEPHVPA
jgi:hypothetical protein